MGTCPRPSLRCLGRRRRGVPESQADGDRDRAALRPHQGEESTMDAKQVGHVNARAREGALRLLHHSIQRWTAPAPQASRPAWQVHRCKTFSAGLDEHPERVYATAASALLRRRPPRRRAPCLCGSSSANDPQRPRTRRASSRFCSQSASTSAHKRCSIGHGGERGSGSSDGGGSGSGSSSSSRGSSERRQCETGQQRQTRTSRQQQVRSGRPKSRQTRKNQS